MTNRLLLTGVGQDRPGIVNALSELIAEVGGSIEESRMSVLGGEFAIIVLISGGDNVIAQLEESSQKLGNATGLSIQTRRTERKTPCGKVLRYHVEVISMDHPGIVHSVTDFFSSKQINIESLSTDTYAAAHSGTPMFALDMIVEIPGDSSVSKLRQAFLEFCDDLNVDASLESV